MSRDTSRKEAAGVVLFFFAIAMILIFYLPVSLTGVIGATAKSFFFGLVGVAAYAIPVFPLVASMIVLSGVSAPRAIPSRIIAFAARSFTEPVGLKYSAFAYSSTPFSPRLIAGSRSSGGYQRTAFRSTGTAGTYGGIRTAA